MPTETSSILEDWIPEPKFAEALRERFAFGSEATLARWRRLKKIPPGLEWRYIGRVPAWREKKDGVQPGAGRPRRKPEPQYPDAA